MSEAFKSFKKENTINNEGVESHEGFKSIEVSRAGVLAMAALAGVLVSAEPAQAQQAPMQNPNAMVQLDTKAIKKFIGDIQFIIKSPETKAAVQQAGEEIKQAGTAAAVEIARPLVRSALEALIKIDQGLNGAQPVPPDQQQVYQPKE